MLEPRSFRIDSDVYREAVKVFEYMGLSIASGINIYLAYVAHEKKIPFPLTATGMEEKADPPVDQPEAQGTHPAEKNAWGKLN